MAVVRFKPLRSPQVLDIRVQRTRETTVRTVQESQNAVARSRELIRKSKEMVATARKLREEAEWLTSRRRLDHC